MSNRMLIFNDAQYIVLYEHTVGFLHWTKAYRLDGIHHIQLLQLTEEMDNGQVHSELMYLHFNDVKRIMLAILADETEELSLSPIQIDVS
ncbi:hypothetical protein [Paenibacillus kobensis]|uniref:hypothetical protein n=1 Tax=Paenibacillus kobensis TaxID=59841 RepID=UPI000FD6F29B|nr:hypothetical protein [Paenibacillus kobensis]